MRRWSTTGSYVFLTARAVLAICVLLSGRALADPQPSWKSGEGLPARAVIQASINPKPLQLPVVDANDLHFVRLSTAQGLSQTRVQQIVQDDSGFIWFGTQYGLNRYDGYRFKVFAHDSSRADSLGGMYIYSLFKDRSGMLWIGSDQTLDRFDPSTEVFRHYQLLPRDSTVGSVLVFHISQDREGYIWLATGAGLFKLDPATGKTTQFQHDPKDPLSLSDNDVKSTLEDRTHRFWVANQTGLDEFDPRTGKVSLHVPVRQSVREMLVHEDRDGVLWLAYSSGSGAGLSTYDPTSNVLSDYSFASSDIRAAFTGVYAVTEDHDGTLWLGTGGMGVLKLDRARQRFLRYRYVPEDFESIADDHVTALLADGEDNIWVGLNSQGPNVFAARPPLFRQVIRGVQSHSGGETLVSSIFQDRHGVLWIGSASGLNRIDPQTGTPVFYRTAEHGVSAGVIAMAEDSVGDMWLGTVGQGLKRFNPQTGKIKTYMHEASNPRSLSDDAVLALKFDAQDKLWVSTWNGLNLFDLSTEAFAVYKRDPGRGAEKYSKFVEDDQGLLWLGSETGLVRFDPRNAKFTVFEHTDLPGTISSNDVNSVLMDSAGRLWLATQNGLDSFNTDGTFTEYLQREGPGGNAISCILEDDVGYLWLSTNRGISRFDRKLREFTNFSTADGVGDLTGWDACIKSSSGEMYFGGFSGVIAFYPHSLVDEPSRARVRLTDLKIQGQTPSIGPDSPLTKSIVYTDTLLLSNEQRNFSLEFASMNFLRHEATRYRYKMDGLDDRWNEVASDQRLVTYTSIPSGIYTFHVEAAVGRAPWTEPGATLSIHVLPPWWKSWWCRTAIVALLFMLVWVAYQHRLRRIARQFNLRLEERVAERTRIARELHDTLLQGSQGMILLFQSIAGRLLKTDPARAEMERGLAYADRLLKEARDRVLELRADDPREPAEDYIERLGKEITEGTPARFTAVTIGKQRLLSPAITDDLYRIAREALVNAVRHARAGCVDAQLVYEDDRLVLRIQDDGVGLDPEVLRHGSRPGHYGVPGMRERATKIGATFSVRPREQGGTEVEVTVPAARAFYRNVDFSR